MSVVRVRANYGVVTFFSTSQAVWAEQVCLARGIDVKMIPTPRKLSSDCGLALRFFWSARDVILETLAEAKIEFALIAEIGAD